MQQKENYNKSRRSQKKFETQIYPLFKSIKDFRKNEACSIKILIISRN